MARDHIPFDLAKFGMRSKIDHLPLHPTRIIVTEEHKVGLAIDHLRKARDLLVDAGANKTASRVRSALKSADGARRHAIHMQQRREAQEGTT